MKFIVKIQIFLLLFIKKVFQRKTVIAIKHPSKFKNQKKWGDYNVACDLANSINSNYENYFAIPIPIDFWYSLYNNFVDVTLLLRGLNKYKLYQNQKNYIYCTSHIRDISDEELNQYDKILFFSENLKNKDNAIYFPAFANTSYYYPVKDANPKYKWDVLFIGNSRNEYRNVVKYCVNNNIDIAVFGSDWEKFIDKKYIKGHLIPNESVKYYYSNSKIILADHWDDMRELGAISNRIYNISACKGFCICDDVKGINTVFKNSIPTFKNEVEFVNLVNYYLNNQEERKAKAEIAYEITTKNYTADNAASILIKIIENNYD